MNRLMRFRERNVKIDERGAKTAIAMGRHKTDAPGGAQKGLVGPAKILAAM